MAAGVCSWCGGRNGPWPAGAGPAANICAQCFKVPGWGGRCPQCNCPGASGVPCESGRLVFTYAGVLPCAAVIPTTAGVSPVTATLPPAGSMVYSITYPGFMLPSPDDFDARPTPPTPKPRPTCADCDREMTPELDAYYGRDPWCEVRCSKCRGRGESR